MPQSLAKILVHTVFSTKERRPFVRDKAVRDELHRYLGGILTNLGCQPIIVGGVEDHVHLLCALSRTCNAAEIVKELNVFRRERAVGVSIGSYVMSKFVVLGGITIFQAALIALVATSRQSGLEAEAAHRIMRVPIQRERDDQSRSRC